VLDRTAPEGGDEAVETTAPTEPSWMQGIELFANDCREFLQLQQGAVEGLKAVGERLAAIENAMGRLEKRLADLAAKDGALERASAELGRLGQESYERHVIEPLVRSVFPLFDLVGDLAGREGQTADRTSAPASKVLGVVRSGLLEFLAPYGVEPFRHKAGAKFNRQLMRPLRLVPTEDKGLHLKVVQSCQTGFRWGERVLRPEAVILYQFKEAIPPSSIPAEERRSP
jgi:molecular chaperone GrpE (heat shock protein)